MALSISDRQLWPLLKQAMEQKRSDYMDGILKGLEHNDYMKAVGWIQALDFVADEAEDIIKRINKDEA
jgi:hypothetical protein